MATPQADVITAAMIAEFVTNAMNVSNKLVLQRHQGDISAVVSQANRLLGKPLARWPGFVESFQRICTNIEKAEKLYKESLEEVERQAKREERRLARRQAQPQQGAQQPGHTPVYRTGVVSAPAQLQGAAQVYAPAPDVPAGATYGPSPYLRAPGAQYGVAAAIPQGVSHGVPVVAHGYGGHTINGPGTPPGYYQGHPTGQEPMHNPMMTYAGPHSGASPHGQAGLDYTLPQRQFPINPHSRNDSIESEGGVVSGLIEGTYQWVGDGNVFASPGPRNDAA